MNLLFDSQHPFAWRQTYWILLCLCVSLSQHPNHPLSFWVYLKTGLLWTIIWRGFLGFFFPKLFDVKNLVKTSKMLANLVEFTSENTFFQKQIPKFCLKNDKNCPKTIQWSRLANFISSLVFLELIVIGQIEGNDMHIQSANVVLNELHPNYFSQAIILFLVALLVRSLHT
jgi:hypothetical protein